MKRFSLLSLGLVGGLTALMASFGAAPLAMAAENANQSATAVSPATSGAASSGVGSLFTRTPVNDYNNIPLLAQLAKQQGAKILSLGERSGLQGWYVQRNGQIQMIYSTPDNKTVIVGAMYTADGDVVTGAQITSLAANNKEVADFLTGAAKDQEKIMNAGGKDGAATVATSGANGDSKLPMASVSPGDRLYQDMQAAAGVTVGRNDKAQLLMVIAPNCPHCQDTWKEFRDSVQKNHVQIKLILFGNSNADNERAAAMLLKAANPFDAWDKYVSGDKAALAGEPDDISKKAILNNYVLIDKWHVRSTPYIVYHSKDGNVKIVQGTPERVAAVLSDVAP